MSVYKRPDSYFNLIFYFDNKECPIKLNRQSELKQLYLQFSQIGKPWKREVCKLAYHVVTHISEIENMHSGLGI